MQLKTHTQTEQDDYIHGLVCEGIYRNTTTSRKLRQGGWAHIKSYIAAGN
jgi:hypothetical protein